MARDRATVRRFTRGMRGAIIGGALLSTSLAARPVRAEVAPPEAGPPSFFCRPAAVLSSSGFLPRNVPAIPFRPSSLAVEPVVFELVGANGTIAVRLSRDDWSGRLSDDWLLRPTTQPEPGDYVLRYQEECSQSDAGGYERRWHARDLPIRFAEATVLPTTAGNLATIQSLSEFERMNVDVLTPSGSCERQQFRFVDVFVDWSIAPDLAPFGEAVKVEASLSDNLIYVKRLGQRFDGSPLERIYGARVSCYGPAAGPGFVDGRGTMTVRSRLAGAAQDFPLLSLDIQLDCPPPESLGPCSDAGPDAPAEPPDVPEADASTEDGLLPDDGFPSADVLTVDALDDRGAPRDTSVGDGPPPSAQDTSSSPDGGDAHVVTPDPTLPLGPRDGCSCSLGAPVADRLEANGSWLLGILMTAGAVLRRRFARARNRR